MTDPTDETSRPGERSGHASEHGHGPGLRGLFQRLLGMKPATSLRHEIEDALSSDDTNDTPDFSPAERAMLKNILGLREQRVDDVMVPRPDIVAVPIDLPLWDILLRFEDAEHSRLPVYGDAIDDLKGMVHIKDVLRYVTTRARSGAGVDLSNADLTISLADANLLREVLYVPPSMPASALLAKMQATRMHMALVIDEYGGTDGLVTIEDLIEIVVGEIEDEHDEIEGPMIQRARDGSLIAHGRTPIEDLVEQLGGTLVLGDIADEVDTVGGLIVTIAGRVPVRNEIIAGPNEFDFEVLEADPRRVKRVRVRRRPETVLGAADPAAGVVG